MICAASYTHKKIHDFLHDIYFRLTSQLGQAAIRKATTQFVRECQLMSTLRHQNIVQFLGVCFFPGSRLPALVIVHCTGRGEGGRRPGTVYLVTHHGLGQFRNNGSVKYFLTTCMYSQLVYIAIDIIDS